MDSIHLVFPALIDFLHPRMLWWSSVIVIPIAIHFWRKQPVSRTDWAAMDLLRRAYAKQRRRWRLHDQLSLACRVVTLLLLAGALANPQQFTWRSSSLSSDGVDATDKPTHHIVMIDASFSMQTKDAAETRFRRAIEQAKAIVHRQSDDDVFSVWSFETRLTSLSSTPLTGRDEVVRLLSTLHPSYARADIRVLPELIASLIDDPAASGFKNEKCKVWLITDLQQVTWNIEPQGIASWQQLAARCDIQLVDTTKSDPENVAIESLQSDLALTNVPYSFQVSIRNFGTTVVAERAVSVTVNGVPIARQEVTIPAGEATKVEFAHTFVEEGFHALCVALTPDALPVDDQRFCEVNVVKSIRTFCWEGTQQAAKPLQAALEASGRVADRFEVQRQSLTSLADRAWHQADVLILCSVTRLREQDGQAIRSFVRAGGGLVILPGVGWDAKSYEATLNQDSAETRLLPVAIGEVTATGDYHFQGERLDHPIVSMFQSADRGGLRSTPIWRYQRLVPHRVESSALKFENGDTAIATARFGAGRVAVCGFHLGRPQEVDSYNALTAWPSFPPLIRGIVSYCASGRIPPSWTVGQDMAGFCPTEEAAIDLIHPTGLNTKIWTRQDGWLSSWRAGPAERPGVYQLRTASGAQLPGFAVNVDPRESDLRHGERSRIAARLKLNPVSSSAQSLAATERPIHVWQRWLMGGVLLLLVVESLYGLAQESLSLHSS